MAGSYAPEFDTPTSRRSAAFDVVTTDENTLRLLPAYKSAPKVKNSANVTVYEAGATSRRTVGWNAPTTSPNHGVLSNLTTLRDRSRAAMRNDGYAKGIADKLVSNLVGTGIRPLSRAKDPELRKQIRELWNKWVEYSSDDGALGWYEQQSQIVRGWVESGELFIRRRNRRPEDGLPVPLQIQVIEPEFCPHFYNTQNGPNRVRAGIEINPIGRRDAYWFYGQRPGDIQEIDMSQLRSVPADDVSHVFDQLRPGQLRGIPRLSVALITLRELDKFDDATLLRQQLSNLFAGFVTRQPSTSDPVINPLTGLENDFTDDNKPMVALEPGIFQELEPGEDVKFSDPPKVENWYGDFVRQQLLRVGSGVGVPYEVFTGDLSKLNDRTMRMVVNEFRRTIQASQRILTYQMCQPVWDWFFDAAILSGALQISRAAYDADPEQFSAVTWTPQGFQYIHPVQDVEATEKAIRIGLTTRSAAVSENGDDAESIDEEQAADNARADSLGLKYDSDGRQPKNGPSAPAAQHGDPGSVEPTAADPDGDGGPHPAPSQNTIRLELATAPMRIVRDAEGRTVGLEAAPS